MPPKASSKGIDNNSINFCWSLASEEAKARYSQQNKVQCNKLYLPHVVSGTPKKNSNNKSIIESEIYSDEANSFESVIADEILHTALRIHTQDETILPYSKSKTIYWPWLSACRSVFLHKDTLSQCKIGN